MFQRLMPKNPSAKNFLIRKCLYVIGVVLYRLPEHSASSFCLFRFYRLPEQFRLLICISSDYLFLAMSSIFYRFQMMAADLRNIPPFATPSSVLCSSRSFKCLPKNVSFTLVNSLGGSMTNRRSIENEMLGIRLSIENASKSIT